MRISDWSSDVCSSDLGQPEDDDVGIVGGEELAALGIGRIGTARFGVGMDEDPGQLPAVVAAALDPQRHVLAEMGELADLDRGAERPRAQLEAQAFVLEARIGLDRSEEHTSELQSLMRISYAVFCLKQKKH